MVGYVRASHPTGLPDRVSVTLRETLRDLVQVDGTARLLRWTIRLSCPQTPFCSPKKGGESVSTTGRGPDLPLDSSLP